MDTNLKKLSTAELENLRYLFYESWSALGEMHHNGSTLDRIGSFPAGVTAYNHAKERLKTAWLAIESTGIMPALFSEAASESINDFSNEEKASICGYIPQFKAS